MPLMLSYKVKSYAAAGTTIRLECRVLHGITVSKLLDCTKTKDTTATVLCRRKRK